VHYFRHYAQTVRSKGSLPSYSTEATEIHHKPLHNAYKRSNKRGRDAIQFILKDQSTMASFQSMVNDFDCEAQTDEHDSEETDGLEESSYSSDCAGRTRTYLWPKAPTMKGYGRVRASLAEKKLFLPGFKIAICRYLTSLNGASEGGTDVMIEFQDPIISTFNSIRISYPTGIEDEIIIRRELMGLEPNGSREPNGRPSQLLRQTTSSLAKSMVTERIKAQPIGTQYGRRDAVLVECPGKESRGRVNTMSRRRIAQVLLLFKCPYWQERLELAFVSWFETKRTADPKSGL